MTVFSEAYAHLINESKFLAMTEVLRASDKIYSDLITNNQIEVDEEEIPYNTQQALYQVVMSLKDMFADRVDKNGRIAGQIDFDQWQPAWRVTTLPGESFNAPPEGTHQIINNP